MEESFKTIWWRIVKFRRCELTLSSRKREKIRFKLVDTEMSLAVIMELKTLAIGELNPKHKLCSLAS